MDVVLAINVMRMAAGLGCFRHWHALLAWWMMSALMDGRWGALPGQLGCSACSWKPYVLMQFFVRPLAMLPRQDCLVPGTIFVIEDSVFRGRWFVPLMWGLSCGRCFLLLFRVGGVFSDLHGMRDAGGCWIFLLSGCWGWLRVFSVVVGRS